MKKMLPFLMIVLCGCGDSFRDKNNETIRDIDRYDPITGQAMQTAELDADKPVPVIYRAPDGKSLIRKNEMRRGWGLVPPPLPQETKKP